MGEAAGSREVGSLTSPDLFAQRVADSLTAEMVVLDRNGNIILTNNAWKRFAQENGGSEIKNLGVGLNYLEVSRSGRASEVVRGLEEILSGTRQRFSFDYPCDSPTETRWFTLQASRLEGPDGGAVLLHFDITEHKLLEMRLQEQEHRFRFALEHSPVVVFNQDRELRYTWINSPVLRWAEQAYLGRTDGEIIGGPEGQSLMEIKKGVIESGTGKRVETTVTFRGEKHYYDLTVEPTRDATGVIHGITCCATDVTPIKKSVEERDRLIEELARTQRQLLERNLELETLNAEKARWLGMAAHDLRNPLSAILVNCEVLMGLDSSQDSRVAVEAITTCVQFMLELLDDVLDISAIESGHQRLSLDLTDLRSLIEKSQMLSRPLAKQKGVEITTLYPERIPAIHLDRHKMLQVFQNLIGNAIKYSSTGGAIEVSVNVTDQEVITTVRDNGPGIPLAELDRIFIPFYRGTLPVRERGTGLGLAICKRIVEAHGGKITAANTLGGGAALSVSLKVDRL